METTQQAVKWTIDNMHSEVLFKVKHLVISTVTGSFKSFNGSVTLPEESLEGAEISFSIDVDSIDTNQQQRDAHLKSADFFDAESFPTINFQSVSFIKRDEENYSLLGNLTIKGVTKLVEVNAEYGGTEKDAYGNQKIGFEVTGTINRKEFGLTYNALTETGGLAIGENIKLIANIQLQKSA
ncbi:YceI family protein [Desertivirga xinjiangensis]|uniref:YceI family protein n=1 Tax=Desertivirga xinjiangensis TaxID=539206 RepID=UPI00210CB094|nr:YceI family protein [Pedobacter xinjiangensis]